jgi:hypothetical protein
MPSVNLRSTRGDCMALASKCFTVCFIRNSSPTFCNYVISWFQLGCNYFHDMVLNICSTLLDFYYESSTTSVDVSSNSCITCLWSKWNKWISSHNIHHIVGESWNVAFNKNSYSYFESNLANDNQIPKVDQQEIAEQKSTGNNFRLLGFISKQATPVISKWEIWSTSKAGKMR